MGGFVLWYWLTAGRPAELLRRVLKVALAVLALGAVAVGIAVAVLALPYLLMLLVRGVAVRAVVRRIIPPRDPDARLLTVERLAVYRRHHGNVDLFARSGEAAEKALLSDGQWALIQRYLDDLKLMRQGLLAEAYVERLEADLFRDCATVTAVIQLRRMSGVNYELGSNGLLNRFIDWLFPLNPLD